MDRIAWSSLWRLSMLSICSRAIWEAKREKPVKNSMTELISSRRRSVGMMMEFHRKTAILEEIDAIEAAIGGPHLVLAADSLFQDVLLDSNGTAGQLALSARSAVQGIQGIQQADDERAARSQARTRRQIGVVMYL